MIAILLALVCLLPPLGLPLLAGFSNVQGAASQPPLAAPAEPELPLHWVDSAYPTLPPDHAVRTVCRSGCQYSTVQAAIDAAAPGDEVVLQAGQVYPVPVGGSIVLRHKSNPEERWIVIRTSNLDRLPPAGTRVSPADSEAMAVIEKSGSESAIHLEAAANHYRLVGLEIRLSPSTDLNYGLINLSAPSQNQRAQVPQYLVIDRCFVHAHANANAKRMVALQSAHTAIVDSYLSDAHLKGQDSQAIMGWNGPGPFKIVNNYLEGAAENIMFGGADASIHELVPSDIEFRRNLVSKPAAWAGKWDIKNLLELKCARRVLIDGNTFENIWGAEQSGFAMTWTPRNQSGGNPWCGVEDITFTNNVIRDAADGIGITGRDNDHPSAGTRRVKIQNNLMYRMGKVLGLGDTWGQAFRFTRNGPPPNDVPADIVIDHNTVLMDSNLPYPTALMFLNSVPTLIYTNNISHGSVAGQGGEGVPTLERAVARLTFVRNVLIGRAAASYSKYRHNAFPQKEAQVRFKDYRGCVSGEEITDCALAENSPYHHWATDGKDAGADIAAILAAQTRGNYPH